MKLKVLQSDKELMRRVAKKDKAAFAELYSRHEGFVRGVVQRYLRGSAQQEDATQNTWVLVWRKASTYKAKAAVSSWLYRVAANCAFMIMRDEGALGERSGDADCIESLRSECAPTDARAMLASEFAKAGRRLNARSVIYGRDCLALHIVGYESKEIAPILNLSIPAVKSRLNRARKAAFPHWRRAA